MESPGGTGFDHPSIVGAASTQFYDLADRLQKRGYSSARIEKILGRNFLRYAREVWAAWIDVTPAAHAGQHRDVASVVVLASDAMLDLGCILFCQPKRLIESKAWCQLAEFLPVVSSGIIAPPWNAAVTGSIPVPPTNQTRSG